MWRLNLFNYLQWEQTVYWYALSISIIRQNAAFVKGFFAGKCGYFYAMGFRRVNCICPHVHAETHVCIEKSCPFEKGQPFLILKTPADLLPAYFAAAG